MKAIETGNEFPSNYNPRETGCKIVDLLKSGAQALPLLASFISYWEYREAREREVMFKNLNERVEKLEEKQKAIFFDKGATDSGDALLNYGFIKASLCHKREQIIKIVDIIMAALAEGIISESDAEMLINIVSELNQVEAQTFMEIKDRHNEQWLNMSFRPVSMDIYREYSEKKKFQMKPVVERLISKGLLIEDGNGMYSFTYYGWRLLEIVYK